MSTAVAGRSFATEAHGKSRQIGLTYFDAYDSVIKASHATKPASVYVSSRDLVTTPNL